MHAFALYLQQPLTDRSTIGEIMAQAQIDILPDDVLLEIFSFYLAEEPEFCAQAWRWPTLVHVCRRWRTIVLQP